MVNKILGVGLCVSAAMSLLVGVVAITPADIWRVLIGAGDADMWIILADIRSPRIVLAGLTGFVLGMGGAVIQGLLRNPLAEPALLGASNSAALGAVIAIYLGLAGTLSFAVPLSAACGALVSVVLLLVFAGRGARSMRLILAGFAVSALAGAGVSLALNLSPNLFAALEIAFWLLGAVENRSWHHVVLALPLCVVGCALMWQTRTALDALALGEEVATSLGVSLRRIRLQIALGLALAVGGVVSVTGVIGFVGLIAPHLVRPWVAHRPSRIVLAAALAGAWLVIIADTLIRAIPTQSELKLGVLTAFLGVPVLLYLLRHPRLGLSASA